MDKRIAAKVLDELDSIANGIESITASGKINERVASDILTRIDGLSDKIESSVFGQEQMRNRVAAVLRADADEPYMKDHFVNTVMPRRTEPDEPYMHEVGASYRSRAIKTFDADRSSSMYNRDEYAVRGADSTEVQPSWQHGPVKDPSYRSASARRRAMMRKIAKEQ